MNACTVLVVRRFYVYSLLENGTAVYVGATEDPDLRLRYHRSGRFNGRRITMLIEFVSDDPDMVAARERITRRYFLQHGLPIEGDDDLYCPKPFRTERSLREFKKGDVLK